MATRNVGSENGNSLVLEKNYPRKLRDEFGRFTLEYLYWCKKDLADSLLPAHNSSPPSPEVSAYPTLVCKGAEINPHDAPGKVRVRVVYRTPTATAPSAGDVFRSVAVAGQEKLILQHPSLTDDEKKELLAQGQETYFQGSVNYRRREIKASFTWSESNVTGGVGSLSSPTGLSGASSNKWLKVGFNVGETDSGTEVEEVWQFDEAGYNASIYS